MIMPDNRSYGDILRTEREYAGIDLATMSRRLHIRPDILSAIENRQFDRMPARGYSKNMVRAYARALNLDENIISEMFLDEIHLYEVGEPRGGYGTRSRFSKSSGDSAGTRRSRNSHSDNSYSPSRSFSLIDGTGSEGRGQSISLASRDIAASRKLSQNGQAGKSSRRSRLDASESNNENRSYGRRASRSSQGRQSSQAGNYPNMPVVGTLSSLMASIHKTPSAQETRISKSYETIGPNSPYAKNNRSRTSLNLSSIGSLRLIIGAIVIIIAIVAVAIIVSNATKPVEDTPNIPISGLTDTSSPEDQNQVSSAKIAPQSAKVVFEVATGQDAWCEVFENGSSNASLAETLEGPTSREYTVSGTLTFKTANPDAVTFAVDGKRVELTKQSDSNYYAYTVDFSEILRKWREENDVDASNTTIGNSASTQSSSSNAANANASNASNTNSVSSSSNATNSS